MHENGKLRYQFGEVYAEIKNTRQVLYDKNCRLPTEPYLQVDPSVVRRVFGFKWDSCSLDTLVSVWLS